MLRNIAVRTILIHRRTGVLLTGKVPVVIVFSAAHAHEAFNACRCAIDTLKHTVPEERGI